MAIGLAFLPVAIVMALFSIRFSAQLIGRFGPARVLLSGQVVIAAALTMLGSGPAHPVYATHLLVPLALLGLGGGLSFPALTMLAMAEVRPADAGLASGLLNTTGQVGGALGLAVLATLAGARTGVLTQAGDGSAAALAGGYHLAWLVGAGTVIVALGLTAAVLRGRPPIPAEREPAEYEAAA
jgi:MFS family permease